MNNLVAFLNGEMIPANTAAIGVTDLAVQRGYGIFDYCKTMEKKPVFLDDHLNRFYRSAEKMRLDPGYQKNELRELLFELNKRNNIPQSGIKIVLTGGYSNDGYTMQQPNIIITQQPLALHSFNETKPLKLVSYPHQRQMADIKTIDYLMAVWLQPYINEKGADDVLYQLNEQVAECPRANLFIIKKDGQMVTPANNMLKGIIRTRLLCHFGSSMAITEGPVTLQNVYDAAEVFITSSSKNIAPVVMVDDHTIGTGQTGAITTLLAEKLRQLMEQENNW